MRVRRGLALAMLVVAAVVAIVTAREWTEGREEVTSADLAASRSDWPEAITHARAAAEALAPASPWPRRGYLRLEAVGHDAEARGDDANALAAYSAMRAAAMATQGVGSGSEVWRSKAEEGLARVAGSQRTLGPHVSSQSTLEALRASETPSTATLTTLSLASLAILGGLGWLVLAGEEGHRGRGATIAQAVAGTGFVVYAVALVTS
jgi:hypothetical protein